VSNYPPIKNYDSSFAYYAGIAQVFVMLHTGCDSNQAAAAVKAAVDPHRGKLDVTAAFCRDVILDAIEAVQS
jgi:hypothetical protein